MGTEKGLRVELATGSERKYDRRTDIYTFGRNCGEMGQRDKKESTLVGINHEGSEEDVKETHLVAFARRL